MTEVPIDNLLDGIRKKNEINKEGLKELLLNLRMQSSLTKFIGEEEKEEIAINEIESLEQLKSLLKDNKTYYIAYDIEESPLNSKRKLIILYLEMKEKLQSLSLKTFMKAKKKKLQKY